MQLAKRETLAEFTLHLVQTEDASDNK